MIRYECNECGELIDDEESMITYDIMHHICGECNEAIEAEESFVEGAEDDRVVT